MCVTANKTNYKSVINTRTSQLAGVFDVSFAAACGIENDELSNLLRIPILLKSAVLDRRHYFKSRRR